MINQKQPQCKNSLMGYKTIESILFHIVQIHLMQEKEMPNKNHKWFIALMKKRLFCKSYPFIPSIHVLF